jgi:hypothetical protein
MKTYYRVMLGHKSVHAQECFNGNFIGADYGIAEDLTGKLPEAWRDFNATFIPKYLANQPEKTKIAAGLACGTCGRSGKGCKRGISFSVRMDQVVTASARSPATTFTRRVRYFRIAGRCNGCLR